MEKHDLLHEFPQHKQKIHDLKVSDNHFRKLFDEYHEVDHHIHRIETDAEKTTDDHLTELRKKRVHIKDQLYTYLK
ncbi:MAG: DUF465 domain-containing protein [Bacteroidetes bacterium]|nr:DUF465 domain-containing protein [Bacteroidota bacterium]